MKYRPQLDGLRAVAVTAVVVYHFYGSHVRGGWAGVDIFFVLSGFLISSILLEEITRFGRISFKNFYLRRFLRLMPAFYCLIIFLVPISCFSKHHRSTDFHEILFSVSYLMNWNRAFAWYPGDGGMLGHTWSLSIEEQFYLFWPMILIYLSRVRKIAWRFTVGYIAIIVSWRVYLVLSGADAERTYNGFDTHSDTLLMGCTLALIEIQPQIAAVVRRFELVAAAAMVLVFIFIPYNLKMTEAFGLSLVGLLSAWILVASLQDGIIARLLSIRPMVYTGRISYGWYLWHYPILELSSGHISRLERPFVMMLSFCIASLSYHLVERPFLKQKVRFASRQSEAVADIEGLMPLRGPKA